MEERITKPNYYLAIAQTVAQRSTCLRRKFGAVIVNNDSIVSTGYNGAPRGRKNCTDIGECTRHKLNIPPGERYELCRSCHAEMNAIIHASRNDMDGATLYLVGVDAATGELFEHPDCCSMCKRMIINSGIIMVVIRDPSTTCGYKVICVEDWVKHDDSLELHEGY